MITSKAKILIVEAELDISLEVKKYLEREGYEVTSVVNNGIEAITRTEYEKPDLILMDIRLNSSLNGVETANIILYRKNIPIIFLTDLKHLSMLKNYYKAGLDEFVLKPIDYFILQNSIDKKLLGLSYQTKIFNLHFSPPLN